MQRIYTWNDLEPGLWREYVRGVDPIDWKKEKGRPTTVFTRTRGSVKLGSMGAELCELCELSELSELCEFLDRSLWLTCLKSGDDLFKGLRKCFCFHFAEQKVGGI